MGLAFKPMGDAYSRLLHRNTGWFSVSEMWKGTYPRAERAHRRFVDALREWPSANGRPTLSTTLSLSGPDSCLVGEGGKEMRCVSCEEKSGTGFGIGSG